MTELFFERMGLASGPTVVLLHGGGGASWSWKPAAEFLGDFNILAPDMPEHGRSRAITPFTMNGAADAVAELIRAHAPGGKAHVVGLSEGAQVAAALLSRSPEVAESAILSSANVRPLPGMWMYTRGMISAAYKMSIPPFRNWDAWIRLNMKYAAGVPEKYYPYFKQDFQEMTEGGFVNLMMENLHFRLPTGLENANLPVLVVAGSKEYRQMLDSARDLAAALPDAKAYTLNLGPKSSLAQEHNWCLTVPELFAAMVRAWVTGAKLPDVLQPLGPGE